MKGISRAIGTLVLILLGTFVNGSAMAGYRGHAYGHGHNHGPNVRIGLSFGFPIYVPRYFSAPVYTYPAYAVPAAVLVYPPAMIRRTSSPVYIERGLMQAAPAPSGAQNDWYYCASSQTYYPYAKECPGGWQRVPPQPSSR